MVDLVFTKIQPAWSQEFESTTGMVGRDLRRRAKRVQIAAKVQVGKETRNLHRHIAISMERSVTGPIADVGVHVEPGIGYAYFHHEGTRPHVIEAKPGQHLRFRGRGGAQIYVTQVRHPGTRANRFLRDNLPLAVI